MRTSNQLLLIVTLSLTLTSCSSNKVIPANDLLADQNTSITSQDTQFLESEPVTDDDLLYDALKEVEDQFELINITKDVLDEIGVKKIITISILQQNDISGMLSIDYEIETDLRDIKFSAFKVFDPFVGDWIVNSVSDVETGKYYWLYDGLNEYMDLYDYNSGDLVSKGEKDLNIDKINDEYEQRNKEILDEFDQDLKDLAEEYNLGY